MPYIIGLSIGLSLFLVLIACFLFYYVKNNELNSKSWRIDHKCKIEIKKEIKKWVKNNDGLYFANSIYRYGKNNVFEIDGILITDYAIIIVKIKNISGIIIGNGTNKYWLRKIRGKNLNFTSPIYQNDQHIKHLLKIFDIKIPILSLIVFGSQTKKLDINNTLEHVLVVKSKDLKGVLNLIKINLMPRITASEKKQIIELIKKHQTKKKTYINLHKRTIKH